MTIHEELPIDLLEEMATRTGDWEPKFTPGNRKRLTSWLTQATLDRGSLERHLEMLLKFRPTILEDGESIADIDTRSRYSSTLANSHAATITDDRLSVVLDEGLGALSDSELASLATNPWLLRDIFSTVDEFQPEAWTSDRQRVGKQLLKQLRNARVDMSVVQDAAVEQEETSVSRLPSQASHLGSSRWLRDPRISALFATAATVLVLMGGWYSMNRLGINRAGPSIGGTGVELHSSEQQTLSLRELLKIEDINHPSESIAEIRRSANNSQRQLIDDALSKSMNDREVLQLLHLLADDRPLDPNRLSQLLSTADQTTSQRIAQMKSAGANEFQILAVLLTSAKESP